MGFDQPKFENPPEENLVEDVNAARAAAEAEDPGRTFLAEHRDELSEEQQKALDWFATGEGEKALANFAREKEEQQDLVRQRAFDVLKINPEIPLADKIVTFRKRGDIDKETYAKRKEKTINEINEELVPTIFKEHINKILGAKESFSAKLEKIEELRSFFTRGIYGVTEYNDYPKVENYQVILINNSDRGKEILKAYFYGSLIPYLVNESWQEVPPVVALAERSSALNLDFDAMVEKIRNKLNGGHSIVLFNKMMEAHNYIFNPKKNRYEKVEG